MTAAVELDELTKVFAVRERAPGLRGAVRGLISPPTREAVAVDRISFRIEPGERVAFVGPNGAGKSTTVKVLSGILHPTSGEARVAGLVPWRERTRLARRIGTVFGQRTQLWYHLPARDTFELLAHVYDQDPGIAARRRVELIEVFGIEPYVDRPVRQLSLGERMRCELVASLLHDPEILFLDEPTIGLDVSAKAVIRDTLREQSRRHGRTVLLTSHDTGDMEGVCDRVIVINAGRLLLDESVATLRRSYIRRKRVTLLTAEPKVDMRLPGVTVTEHGAHRTTLEVDTRVMAVEAVVQAAMRQSHLRDLTIEDPPMEEIVARIYAEAAPPGADRLTEVTP